jgi:hypothetical protein
MPAHERAGRSGVVEVNVCKDEMAYVGQREPVLTQPLLKRIDARRRTAIDKRGLVAAQEIRADDLRAPEVEEVDEFRHGGL